MKVKLKDLGVISTGNTPSKNIPEFYNSKDIGFVKPDVISDSQIDSVEITQEYLSEAARRKARIVKKDAIIVTCIGTIGKVGIVKAKELAFNQQINAITPNGDIVSKYLAYCIFANRKKLQAIANAPVVPIINKTQFGDFEVDITSNITRQELIVKTLDLINNIITLRKQQLQQLDELVKARFVEMFGNRGENPYNFPTTTMGNVYKFQYGKGNNIPEDKGEYPCYGSNGVVGHHTEYNSEDSPIIGHIGAYAGIVNWGKGKHYVTYNGVICKLINDQVNPVYGYYLLQLQDYNAVAKSGAAQPFVSYKDLDAPVVNVPSMEVQNQFASFVKQTDKSKVAVQKALDEAQTLFDSLMQEYFG